MDTELMIGEKVEKKVEKPEQYIGQVDRDITLIGDNITDTISFYFEKTQSGSNLYFWQLMNKRRMAFIFKKALNNNSLSGQKREQIKSWFINNQ